MAEYLLAHDLGTSGNKATLFDINGTLVKSVVASYRLYTDGNRSEQDPEDWWRAVCDSTRELLDGIDPGSVLAVSFSGQMMGCVCVDRNGEPLRRAIIWADMRSGRQADRIRERIGEKEYYQLTGHRISSSYSSTKLMWVKDEEPDVYRNTYKMLNAKDYVILKLTGRFVTEPSDASSTCLLNLKTQAFSDTLFEMCGLSMDKMPELLRSIDVAGKVTREASVQCGLREGTPVVCGGGDGVCAAIGTGAVRPGIANCCLGTSSWISFASEKPVYAPDMSTFQFAHIVPGMIMPCGTMQSGGGALSWAVNCFCDKSLLSSDYHDKKGLYDQICELVSRSSPGAKGMLFLPYLMGERSPRWNDKAKGCFIGLTTEHTLGDIFRSVMEGVAMNLSVILDAFRNGNGRIDQLVLIGGGARNVVWRQILSDVLNVRIKVPNYLEEATSMGAAITAGVGVGVFHDFSVIDRFLKTESEYYPAQENRSLYERLREVFDRSYEDLIPIFGELHDLSARHCSAGKVCK